MFARLTLTRGASLLVVDRLVKRGLSGFFFFPQATGAGVSVL